MFISPAITAEEHRAEPLPSTDSADWVLGVVLEYRSMLNCQTFYEHTQQTTSNVLNYQAHES